MNASHSTKSSTGRTYAVRCRAALSMVIFALLSGLTTTGQQTNTHQSNFYAVTGNDLKDRSWLFGTYHLVKSSYLIEVPAVVHAFNKAIAVAVEMVSDSVKIAGEASKGLL